MKIDNIETNRTPITSTLPLWGSWRGLLFDLDGTLTNTLDDLHESVGHALSMVGLPQNDIMDTRRFLGNGIKNLIDKSVENVSPGASEELKAQVLQFFREYYVQHSLDKTAPYDGIMDMLHECKRRGYITAIVSNKLDPAVKDIHRMFFQDCIDIAIGETPDLRRKPAPDMVNEAIRQLSLLHHRTIPLSDCIYIGDSEVDLQTAQNSGLPCISVSWGFRDKDYLIECGAKVIADHPSEIMDCLRRTVN